MDAAARRRWRRCSRSDPRRRILTTCSRWPPRPPFCAGSPSSPADRGRGRPRPWPGCWRCSTSRRSPGAPPAAFALAAPTGKAARGWRRPCTTRRLRLGSTRARGTAPRAPRRRRCTGCSGTPAATGPGSGTTVNPLRHDVVVVDETSMVVAVHDGPAARGTASRRAPDHRRRPRAARIGRSRRRPRRHRRAGARGLCMDETARAATRGGDRVSRSRRRRRRDRR